MVIQLYVVCPEGVCDNSCTVQYVIVIARVPGIYGSKQTESEGEARGLGLFTSIIYYDNLFYHMPNTLDNFIPIENVHCLIHFLLW